MSHPVHRVTAFEIIGPYRIRLSFEDGLTRTVDFSAVLEGELFGPLRDLDTFNAVSIDSEIHTLVWPSGADFDPAILHDWPEHAGALADMARRWATAREKAS